MCLFKTHTIFGRAYFRNMLIAYFQNMLIQNFHELWGTLLKIFSYILANFNGLSTPVINAFWLTHETGIVLFYAFVATNVRYTFFTVLTVICNSEVSYQADFWMVSWFWVCLFSKTVQVRYAKNKVWILHGVWQFSLKKWVSKPTF